MMRAAASPAVAVLVTFTAAGWAQEQQAPEVRSSLGVIVTGSGPATAAGLAMLEAGGNAVDAAVAAAFALAVAEPSQSGIGGRTHLLLRTAAGEFFGLDGWTEVPAAAINPLAGESDTAYGYATIAVPGTVAALSRALAQYGTLPLARVMAPAITLAEGGVVLPAGEAGRLASASRRLREFAGSTRAFLKPNGAPYAAGERLVQPDLARVLRAVALQGPDVFYRGWIAESIAADMERSGGLVRRGDLAGYRPDLARVVRGSYRGHELVGTYFPASGVTVIEALQILENFPLAGLAGGSQWAGLVARALLAGFADRDDSHRQPADTTAGRLTSRAWAARRAADIRAGRLRPSPPQFDPDHTTHVSVVDQRGTIVALTQSLGPNLGSKVVTPGLGFLYAATMGYLAARAPGDRPFSSQAPLIVLRDGQPVYVTGGGGGRRIVSASVAVLSRLIDQGWPLAAALAAPRLHPAGDRLMLESGPGTSWPAAARDSLRALGFTVEPVADGPYFARLHALARDTSRQDWIGVADHRWSGVAAGVPARR
ncbi:MAG TPA: gamma-glutamyltransferase [Gemmatimonadales bacterium]|nr:gamma-glutamyltransferase [Gemmatimonadales bacterium]